MGQPHSDCSVRSVGDDLDFGVVKRKPQPVADELVVIDNQDPNSLLRRLTGFFCQQRTGHDKP